MKKILLISSLCMAVACKSSPKVETITVDGSSTVFPITEAVAEGFQKSHPNHRVTIGISGTGGGFKKLCRGEVAIVGASRPITATEVEACRTAKVEPIELPVAYDGIAIVVHKQNTWASHITVEELKRLWAPEAQGQIKMWNQIRPEWPNKEIHLFGAGVDSGTYDYFTHAVVGKEHSSRGDFTSSEDDNVLVHGISSDPYALGFFGLAYFNANQDKLKLVPVDNGTGPVSPSSQTVVDGTYQPLSRPLFIYVAKAAAETPHVAAFVNFYLTSGAPFVTETGYIALPNNIYDLVKTRFSKREAGSVFAQGAKPGMTLDQLFAIEAHQ